MKIFVYGKELEVTNAIRDFASKQITKRLSKLSSKIQAVRLYLENISRKDNDPQSATVKCQIEIPGKNLLIRSKSHDLYQAISNVAQSASRRLRKTKERKIDQKKQLAN